MTTTILRTKEEAKKSVVTVADGRGFVINGPEIGLIDSRLVITAAHCLPTLPLSFAGILPEDRFYLKSLGPLGTVPTVSAECLFADPVADLAVLCIPDDYEEAEAYEKLVESTVTLPIRNSPKKGYGWVLSLGGEWLRVEVDYWREGRMIITNEKGKIDDLIQGGMSGSPIISEEGAAIGVVSICTSNHGISPRLIRDLPVWLAAPFLAGAGLVH
jgi:hypothetical protein